MTPPTKVPSTADPLPNFWSDSTVPESRHPHTLVEDDPHTQLAPDDLITVKTASPDTDWLGIVEASKIWERATSASKKAGWASFTMLMVRWLNVDATHAFQTSKRLPGTIDRRARWWAHWRGDDDGNEDGYQRSIVLDTMVTGILDASEFEYDDGRKTWRLDGVQRDFRAMARETDEQVRRRLGFRRDRKVARPAG